MFKMTYSFTNEIITGSTDQRIARALFLGLLLFYSEPSGGKQRLILWLHTKQAGMGSLIKGPPQRICFGTKGVWMDNYITDIWRKIRESLPAEMCLQVSQLFWIVAFHFKDRKLLYLGS